MTIGPTVPISDYVYQTHVTEISLFCYMSEHNHGPNPAGDFPFYVNTFLIGSVNNYNTHKPTDTHIHTHLHPNRKMRLTKNNEIRKK